MTELPPPLILPAHFEGHRPAIIRPEIDPLRYFPVELSRGERRAIHAELRRAGRVEAMLPGMVPVIAAKPASGPALSWGDAYGTASSLASHVLNMPPGSGGKLLFLVCCQEDRTHTTPSGWTLLFNAVSSGGSTGQNRRLLAYTRTADGSEGATLTHTINSAASSLAGIIYRATGVSGGYSAATSSGNSSSADPPNLNLTTSENTIWIAAAARRQGDGFTAAPSGYGDLQAAMGTTATSFGSAHKIANLSSDDPGAFAIASGSNYWAAATLGIR